MQSDKLDGRHRIDELAGISFLTFQLQLLEQIEWLTCARAQPIWSPVPRSLGRCQFRVWEIPSAEAARQSYRSFGGDGTELLSLNERKVRITTRATVFLAADKAPELDLGAAAAARISDRTLPATDK
jgi:hypothetical protein